MCSALRQDQLLFDDEICSLAFGRAGADPDGGGCWLDRVLHVDVPEGKFIASQREFDALRFSGSESELAKSFQLFYWKGNAGSAKADIEFYRFFAGARSGISYRRGNMQRWLRFVVQSSGTELGRAQLQRRISKFRIAQPVAKGKQRGIWFVHVTGMVFFDVVPGRTSEIDAIGWTARI